MSKKFTVFRIILTGLAVFVAAVIALITCWFIIPVLVDKHEEIRSGSAYGFEIGMRQDEALRVVKKRY